MTSNEKKTDFMPQGEYKCPLGDCTKTYKNEGWLKRHIISCRFKSNRLNQNPQEIRAPRRTGNTISRINNDLDEHSYPGRDKKLPTSKRITNHCYVVHRWSIITGQ